MLYLATQNRGTVREPWPTVSVIMPIRNEVGYIHKSLEAVLQQDYPRDRVEVLVVDGMSDDGTREYLRERMHDDERIRLLDNPRRIVPTALNIALRHARGDIVVRVDGHCEIAPDYVRACVHAIETHGVECVGGPIETVGVGVVGRAIAAAMSSPFGVGTARFRTNPGEQRLVDHLAFGAYRRTAFDLVGTFDEELVRNQDDEFSFRLTRAGGRILLTPEARSRYFGRGTLKGLWRQYFEYGFWKVRVIQKHRRLASWRHLVPLAFVAAVLGTTALGGVTGSVWWPAAVLLPYAALNLIASVSAAGRAGWGVLAILPPVFATLHVAYGIGFGWGVWAFLLSRRRGRPAPWSPERTTVRAPGTAGSA